MDKEFYTSHNVTDLDVVKIYKISANNHQQLCCILCPEKSTKPPVKQKKGEEDEYELKNPMAATNNLDLYIQEREEIVVDKHTQYMSCFICRCCFPFF